MRRTGREDQVPAMNGHPLSMFQQQTSYTCASATQIVAREKEKRLWRRYLNENDYKTLK
jgi:hypothetical protein